MRVLLSLGGLFLCARWQLLTDSQARDLAGLYLAAVLGLEGYKRGRVQNTEPEADTAETATAAAPALARDGGDEAGEHPASGADHDG